MDERLPQASLGPHSLGRWVGAIMMGKYMVEKVEKEKQKDSCVMERGRMEEVKVARNRLM